MTDICRLVFCCVVLLKKASSVLTLKGILEIFLVALWGDRNNR